MEEVSIFFNSECQKCNSVMEILKQKKIQAKVINYLDGNITEEDIKTVLAKLKISAEKLVRKTEHVFKENFADKKMTDEDYIQAMLKYPILIQRPIIVKGNQAIIGRPPEYVLDIL
ncbi:MAG: arsenate reductase (glutaredoxin) [Bacteroidetes bacterium]|nr:arsenate reductase (glutaredoxin) [Bacteroidota bacterium]